MDVRQVEFFLAVVDHGTFSAAARALYVAQPSLSQSIRRLEESLGEPLFDRGGGRVSLTAAGQRFEQPARQLMSRVSTTRDVANQISALGVGELTIAATSTLTMDPLPALVHDFHALHPGIRWRIVDPLTRKELMEAVSSGAADVGLTDMPRSDPRLHWVHLGSQEIVLVLPPHLSDWPPGRTSLDELDGLEFVVASTGSSEGPITGREIQGRPVRVGVECATWGSVVSLVRSGAGATFLSRTVAERHFDLAVIRRVEPPVVREVGLVHRAASSTPTTAAFVSSVLATAGGGAQLD